jgi:hypothetical protein
MPTADVRDRLIILHRLLTKEMIRNARLNAVEILRDIAAEAKLLKPGERLPDAPTADPKIRIEYWHELFRRAEGYGDIDGALRMLREIRKETLLVKV